MTGIRQVLILADVAGYRNGDGWFSQSDLRDMFDALRLPVPKSLSRDLTRLRDRELIRNRSTDSLLTLTPKGRNEAQGLLGEFDYGRIEAELVASPGADYADVRHTVIPPAFAPARWQSGIKRHLDQFPFETNVFCMTRFPRRGEEDQPDPQQAVIDRVREAVQHHGLTLHLASDRQIEDELFPNVVAHMWTSQYGLGLLESRDPKRSGLNDNVLIELGSMLVMGRRCAILKDRGAPQPPSDLSGQIYKSVDFDDLAEIREATHRWVRDDLALGPCSHCPEDDQASGSHAT
jgi:hypothetical protein